MARPVDHDKRLQIARAALAVLRDRGVSETRMAHVAQALGMKRPTLYHYFGSLGELYDFAMAQLRQAEAAFVAERLAGVDHPLDALYVTITESYGFYADRGLDDFVFLLCQGWTAGDADRRRAFHRVTLRYVEPARALLIGLVAQGVADGRVRPCDPERVVDLALSVLHGAIVHEVILGVPGRPTFELLRETLLEPLRGGAR